MTVTNIRTLRLHNDAVLPTKGSEMAAGHDLYAYIPKQPIQKKINSMFLFFSSFIFFFFFISIFLGLPLIIHCVTVFFTIVLFYIKNVINDLTTGGGVLCEKRSIVLLPQQRILVKTGISIEIPTGKYYARIAPRSGLSINNGIDILGGVIDADFRGEIKIILINHGTKSFTINHQDRVAQLIFEKIAQIQIVQVDDLSETNRGNGGFGSTGI